MDIDKLLSIMENKKISSYQLAKMMNVTYSTVSGIILKKKKNPRINTVSKIAKALNVKVDDLLLDEYK